MRDEDVGPGRPPRHSRFKKGRSGCPSGGHDRRVNQEARKQKAADQELRRQEALDKMVFGPRRVRSGNRTFDIAAYKFEFHRIQNAALQGDRSAQARYLDYLITAGLIKPRPPGPSGGGVLVVYPELPDDEPSASPTPAADAA